jgi:hypothetical protein
LTARRLTGLFLPYNIQASAMTPTTRPPADAADPTRETASRHGCDALRCVVWTEPEEKTSETFFANQQERSKNGETTQVMDSFQVVDRKVKRLNNCYVLSSFFCSESKCVCLPTTR